jgi:beta-glucosidase
MAGRTYRYFRGEPLFPFGHGLSYTQFAYRNLSMSASVEAGKAAAASVEVENTGDRAGEEVVQLYVTHDRGTSGLAPIRALEGFARVALEPGARTTLRFTLTPRSLALVEPDGRRISTPGIVHISVGGKQPGFKGVADAPSTQTMTGTIRITGAPAIVK